MPICAVCGAEIKSKNRVRSHSITNASFLKALQKDSPDRILGINTQPGKIFDPYKYIRESGILCVDCDHKIGVWEEEREKLFSINKPEELFKRQSMIMPGFDGAKIKLACIADILRCSLFRGTIYESISLGEKHEKKLIEMIKNGNCGTADEYTVMIGAYRDALLERAGGLPKRIRLGGKTLYETIVPRGWLIWIKIDSRSDELLAVNAVDSLNDGLLIANFDSPNLKQRLRDILFTAVDNTDA